MWKAARSLAHRALGPKRRRYDVPLAEQPRQPSANAWETFFQSPASEGGCNARVLDGHQQFLDTDEMVVQPLQPYHVVCDQAERDYQAVKRFVKSHPVRKKRPLLERAGRSVAHAVLHQFTVLQGSTSAGMAQNTSKQEHVAFFGGNTNTVTTGEFSMNNCFQEKAVPLQNIWAVFGPTIFSCA